MTTNCTTGNTEVICVAHPIWGACWSSYTLVLIQFSPLGPPLLEPILCEDPWLWVSTGYDRIDCTEALILIIQLPLADWQCLLIEWQHGTVQLYTYIYDATWSNLDLWENFHTSNFEIVWRVVTVAGPWRENFHCVCCDYTPCDTSLVTTDAMEFSCHTWVGNIGDKPSDNLKLFDIVIDVWNFSKSKLLSSTEFRWRCIEPLFFKNTAFVTDT